jgi:hypothetical protein
MSNPSKDPKFNEALRRMLDAKPKANEELKKKNQPKPTAKS